MPQPAQMLPQAKLPSGQARLWTANEGPCVLQVTVTDLCPAGPIQAMEIQVESSSLANMCRAHHAIVRRLQVCSPSWASLGSLCGVVGTQDSGVLASCPGLHMSCGQLGGGGGLVSHPPGSSPQWPVRTCGYRETVHL